MNVSWRDGQQQGDQAATGRSSESWDHDADAAEDLENPLDVDQHELRRQVRRHDLGVDVRLDEMVDAGERKEQADHPN